MYDRCKAHYAKHAVNGSAYAMTGGIGEDGVQRGYCAEEGEGRGKRPIDRLEVRFATKAEVRRRQRGAEERCNDREVIGLTSNAAHGFAVIEGDVVAAVVSLQPFSKVTTAAAAAYLPQGKRGLTRCSQQSTPRSLRSTPTRPAHRSDPPLAFRHTSTRRSIPQDQRSTTPEYGPKYSPSHYEL